MSLDLTGVTVRFGGLTALKSVSFNADAGEIVGLIGPNGSGKTTLLNVVTGLVKPASGDVRIGTTSCRRLTVHRRGPPRPGPAVQPAALLAPPRGRGHLPLPPPGQHTWRRGQRP